MIKIISKRAFLWGHFAWLTLNAAAHNERLALSPSHLAKLTLVIGQHGRRLHSSKGSKGIIKHSIRHAWDQIGGWRNNLRMALNAPCQVLLRKRSFKFNTEFKNLAAVKDFLVSFFCECMFVRVCVSVFRDKKGQRCLTSRTPAVLVALSCLWREIHLSSAICVSVR